MASGTSICTPQHPVEGLLHGPALKAGATLQPSSDGFSSLEWKHKKDAGPWRAPAHGVFDSQLPMSADRLGLS